MADKIVDYYTYCPRCAHWKEDENSEACNECLSNPVNEDSKKPTGFKEK